jgi:hypothetical protein
MSYDICHVPYASSLNDFVAVLVQAPAGALLPDCPAVQPPGGPAARAHSAAPAAAAAAATWHLSTPPPAARPAAQLDSKHGTGGPCHTSESPVGYMGGGGGHVPHVGGGGC